MKLDARGKPCPQPVVLSLHALAQLKAGEELDVLVDNEAAVENLRRMAAQKGRSAVVTQEDNFWHVCIGDGNTASAPSAQPQAAPACCAPMGSAAVVAVGTDVMGRGSEELGRALIKSFLYALAQLEVPPVTLLFFNGGAKLTVEGSQSLEDLRTLEEAGTEILTCGTCLNHYGLTEQLAVGGVTNMYDIVEKLTHADLVVKP